MPKREFKKINMYGSSIAGAASPKVYIFKGASMFDLTASASAEAAVWDDAPVTVGAEHECTLVIIPLAANPIGVEVTIPEFLPVGQFDLVFLDGVVYKTGIRIKRQSDGKIVDVTNKDGNSQ